MPNFSKMSTEELLKIVEQNQPVADKTIAELRAIAGLEPEEEEPGFFKQAAQKILAPVQAVSEAIDPYTGAPLRAAVGAAQRGGTLGDVGKAFGNQIVAGEVLPTTPGPEEIVRKESIRAGMPKEFAEKSAEYLGPVAGAVLDITNFIPSSVPLKGASNLAKFSSKAVGAGGKLAEVAAEGATKGFLRTGEAITMGNLDAAKAAKAAKNLSSAELMFPGNMKFGFTKQAAKEIGEMRQALRDNPVVVPGSRDALSQVRNNIVQAEKRALSSPQSKGLLELIDNKLQPKTISRDVGGLTRAEEVFEDLTLDEIDDIIGNMDDAIFTGAGNERMLRRMWGPVLKNSRRELDKVLQTVPEGQLFKEAKSRFEDLSTAGKQRGKLLESVSMAGLVGGIFNPTALSLRFLSPTTYMQVIGAAKLPKDAVELIAASRAAGKVEDLRDALAVVAKKHPEATERLIRGAILASGKEETDENPGFSLPKTIQVPKGLSLPTERNQ